MYSLKHIEAKMKFRIYNFKIALKLILKGSIDNKPASVPIMSWQAIIRSNDGLGC